MGRPPKFERIVLSINEAGFEREKYKIQELAERLNKDKNEILEALEISLTDDQMQRFIIDRENMETFIGTLYSDQPPKVREYLKNEIRSEFKALHNDNYLYSEVSEYRSYLTVKNNKITVTDLDKLKTKFEYSLESARAKTAFELHRTAVESVKKLLEMGAENQIFLNVGNFFDFDREGNIHPTQINYNKF